MFRTPASCSAASTSRYGTPAHTRCDFLENPLARRVFKQAHERLDLGRETDHLGIQRGFSSADGGKAAEKAEVTDGCQRANRAREPKKGASLHRIIWLNASRECSGNEQIPSSDRRRRGPAARYRPCSGGAFQSFRFPEFRPIDPGRDGRRIVLDAGAQFVPLAVLPKPGPGFDRIGKGNGAAFVWIWSGVSRKL